MASPSGATEEVFDMMHQAPREPFDVACKGSVDEIIKGEDVISGWSNYATPRDVYIIYIIILYILLFHRDAKNQKGFGDPKTNIGY